MIVSRYQIWKLFENLKHRILTYFVVIISLYFKKFVFTKKSKPSTHKLESYDF